MRSRALRALPVGLLGLLAFGAPVHAQLTTGFFADVPLGARRMGMGGAGAALADDAYAPLYNPAGLAQIDDLTFTVEYADLFELGLVKQTYFGALFRAAGFHHSLAYQNLAIGFDPLPGALDEGTATYSFGYGLGDLSVGASIKYHTLSSSFALVEGSGFGVDLGAIWRLSNRWTIGVSGRNIASRISFGTGTDESIPQVFRFGVGYRRGLRFAAALDLLGERGEAVKEVRFGGEYWLLHPAAARIEVARPRGDELFGRRPDEEPEIGRIADLAFALRGGVRAEIAGSEKAIPTFGLSFGLSGLLLDYAFEADNGAAGETNRFSLTYAFPVARAPEAPEERERREPDRPMAPTASSAPARPPGRAEGGSAPLRPPPRPTVAVLDLEDRAGRPETAWVGKGFAEVLASEWGSARYGLAVVPRARTAGRPAPDFEAARASGATHVVAGTFVLAADGRVVVAARLYRADGRLVDFAEAEGRPDEIFAMGRSVAEALGPAALATAR